MGDGPSTGAGRSGFYAWASRIACLLQVKWGLLQVMSRGKKRLKIRWFRALNKHEFDSSLIKNDARPFVRFFPSLVRRTPRRVSGIDETLGD